MEKFKKGDRVRIVELPVFCRHPETNEPLEGAPVKLIGRTCVVIEDEPDYDGTIFISDNLNNPEEGSFIYHPKHLEKLDV